MQAKFVDVAGVRTRYLYAGAGNKKALLLIHGSGLAAESWMRNIDALGEQFAVYAPDNLGHGFTDAIDLGAGIPQPHTARHLARFMETIGIERYAAAGSSYGALIAGLMYFDHPNRLEQLILIGSSSVFDRDEVYRKALAGAYANATSALANPTLETCRKRMANAVYDVACVPEGLLLMQLTQYAQADRLDFYIRANRNRSEAAGKDDARILGKLEQIHVPTLIITGKQDKRADWEATQAGVRRIPHAELHLFDKCGHLPYLEHPNEFNALVTEFLRRF